MRILFVALVLAASLNASHAASGRYTCKAGSHTISFDFGRKTLTLDDKTDALIQGVATFWASPGGRKVIVAPSDKPATRIFDISIDQGSEYSGFVICKTY